MRRRLKETLAASTLLVVSASACTSQPHPTTSITVYASSAMINGLTAIGCRLIAFAPGADRPKSLVIATASGNRDHLALLTDLARPGVRVAVCRAPDACGVAARQLQAAAVCGSIRRISKR